MRSYSHPLAVFSFLALFYRPSSYAFSFTPANINGLSAEQIQSINLFKDKLIQGSIEASSEARQLIDSKISESSQFMTHFSENLSPLLSQTSAPLPSNVLELLKLKAAEFTASVAALNQVENKEVFAPLAITLSVLSVFAIKSTLDGRSAPSTPYPSGKYNPVTAEEYFRFRRLDCTLRSIELFGLSFGFGLALLSDYAQKLLTDPRQEEKRAQELTELLTRLGPNFIKLGQSLSIRTDALRPAYAKALSQLQDRVPSYPTSEARALIERELGRSIESMFVAGLEPGASTIAAASLGQVYRVRLKDGTEAAVKVQRPNVLLQAALDMYLIRGICPILASIFNVQTDTVALVDEWATGFIAEMDYSEEASNAELFSVAIAKTPLAGRVFAPEVLREFSSPKVLTTRWVDGVKIEKSNPADIPSYCALAMSAYLTMMLEIGTCIITIRIYSK